MWCKMATSCILDLMCKRIYLSKIIIEIDIYRLLGLTLKGFFVYFYHLKRYVVPIVGAKVENAVEAR